MLETESKGRPLVYKVQTFGTLHPNQFEGDTFISYWLNDFGMIGS